ncbi:translation initiation factor IF-2, mitochondrial, partial [Periophthalmus magnuspinnatus]|uniref:translation initiation factor IF-2, mitochondrial n=1 Tax=Periophthalmus magnuspinnatus TaxID=409849 RepID=UPI002436438E
SYTLVPSRTLSYPLVPSCTHRFEQHRAREVVAYRQHLDEQQRLGEEQKTIAANQEAHLQQYRLQRAELAHLSWRQRKSALYQKNKEAFASRPRERDTDQSTPRLGVVVKGDVDGSVETLLNVLDSYDAQHQCELNLIHFGTGDISETDVSLAHTFSGSVYGFNVSVARSVQQVALQKGVPLRLHSVIYKLIEELKQELSQKLPPETLQTVLGEASVLAVFEVSVGKRKVPVAGCRVQRGVLDKRHHFRVLRGALVLWEGSLSALKHHKDDVSSVKSGMDCGLSADGDVDFKPGDMVQCYEEVQSPQTCSWNPPGF